MELPGQEGRGIGNEGELGRESEMKGNWEGESEMNRN